ncbi:hypothetical protein QQ008_01865 [Fulvivirgaceae bacterium BMA10]|uniref:Calx-beta domain-containing protein n=1 Tax=Splendidivirga corallicola TaxID=3051826 RepID=A0ABT8KIJ5_9BACT|nr:hypothetical protein [Fulvivirgaceae bacterium BMA10]
MKTIRILTLFLVGLTIFSCEEEDLTYQGPLQVELAKGERRSNQLVNYLKISGNTVRDSALIQLIGPHQSNAISVEWRINPDNSTAVEGLHYNILSSGPVSIPAGSSFAQIDFEILTDNIDLGETFTLAFELVSSSVKVSPNSKEWINLFGVQCPSDLAGEYERVTTFGWHFLLPDFPSNTETVTLTEIGSGEYFIEDITGGLYTGPYTAFGTTARNAVIKEVCGDILLENIPDQWGGFIRQDPDQPMSNVDPNTGVITIYWIGDGDGSNAVSVYTPQ